MSIRFVLAAGIVAILALACSSDSPKPDTAPTSVETASSGTPGAATTPVISLTPRPGVRADLAAARSLEAEGNIEEAAEVYIALAGVPATRSEGTLGAARLLLELERPNEARTLLEPFVAAASGQDVAARYMLARAFTALGLHPEALQQYDLYIQSGRPAQPYAQLDRARNLLELNRPLEAVTAAQAGLAMGVPPGARQPFRTMIAQAYERAGSLNQAIAAYQELLDGGDAAFALSRIAALKREKGDPTSSSDVIRLIASYPTSAAALSEIEQASLRGEAIPAVLIGIVYYRHNDYGKAEPRFREQISLLPADPSTAEAYYYLAAIQESRNEVDAALANYERATPSNPASFIADDAIWWRARILQDRGSLGDAQLLYARLANEYPNSSWANDAAFRQGMLSYVKADYDAAATIWSSAAAATASAAQRERLSFWQAKALLQAGKKPAAEPILLNMAASAEDDFYGIRAAGLLDGEHKQPKAQRESSIDLNPAFDWPAAEAWLALNTGRAVVEGGWIGDPRWSRAQELWLVGRLGQGDSEVFNLLEAYATDAIAMYTIARRLQSEGRVGMSGRAGQRLLRVLNTNPNQGLPKALLSLSYPPAFGALVAKYAGDEKISPLLMLAFVRQESFFDPRAESPVGALGLTQVLPATGRSVASKLGLSNFEVPQLLHAGVNLRLGAHYMAQQLRDFDDEIFVAFAAYNAGPNAAARWRDADGTADADVYLESVEFAETRLYIEIVGENYAIYRYLYGGESKPTLPH